jgi:hypothetical protein
LAIEEIDYGIYCRRRASTFQDEEAGLLDLFAAVAAKRSTGILARWIIPFRRRSKLRLPMSEIGAREIFIMEALEIALGGDRKRAAYAGL